MSLGVTLSLFVCVQISLGSEGNVLYPLLSSFLYVLMCFDDGQTTRKHNASNTPISGRRHKLAWKLREFCATSGKKCNEQSIFSLSFKYLVRVRW